MVLISTVLVGFIVFSCGIWWAKEPPLLQQCIAMTVAIVGVFVLYLILERSARNEIFDEIIALHDIGPKFPREGAFWWKVIIIFRKGRVEKIGINSDEKVDSF